MCLYGVTVCLNYWLDCLLKPLKTSHFSAMQFISVREKRVFLHNLQKKRTGFPSSSLQMCKFPTLPILTPCRIDSPQHYGCSMHRQSACSLSPQPRRIAFFSRVNAGWAFTVRLIRSIQGPRRILLPPTSFYWTSSSSYLKTSSVYGSFSCSSNRKSSAWTVCVSPEENLHTAQLCICVFTYRSCKAACMLLKGIRPSYSHVQATLDGYSSCTSAQAWNMLPFLIYLLLTTHQFSLASFVVLWILPTASNQLRS